jgi:GrpB-like predicted nucleotidyltransferase (UPF0157 family)/aminoglycoside phosphotransferase (APT) family kinase protein/GNAT superfamily N-acetyltransferase
MTFKMDWEKSSQQHSLSNAIIERMVALAYPGGQLISYHMLEGGCSNLNLKLHLKDQEKPVMLRIYLRDKISAFREEKLGELLKPTVPLPQTYYIGQLESYQFAITEFMPGIPLRTLLLGNAPYDLSQIMHEVGVTLSKIASYKFPSSGLLDENLTVSKENKFPSYTHFLQSCLQNKIVQATLPAEVISKITHYFNKYNRLLPNTVESHLVHADFDPANILVDFTEGEWKISAVLDWEFSFSGSILWDVATMMRYAHQMPQDFQDAFIAGLMSQGITLPATWRLCVHLLNLLSLLDCLTRADLSIDPHKIADIEELITYILKDLDTFTSIKIVPYNSEWPQQFEREAAQLKEVLGKHCLKIHHIGSTSIPGLAAKEDIDILCIVDHLTSALAVQQLGYIFKDEINIPLRYFFSKNKDGSKINLHVTEAGHGFIDLNLKFCEYMRHHADSRQAYQDLKYKLLQDPTSFRRINGRFPKYTLEKNSFIKSILDQADFKGITFNFCVHYAEWEAAKQLRQTYFFDPLQIDDPYTWTFNHPEHIHLVMYKGTKIIGYAHIQLWKDARAALRIIVIDEENRYQGFGTKFLGLIEKWLTLKKYKSLHIESSEEALLFYRKGGYKDMPFNDPDGYESDPRDIAVGKSL